MKNWLEAFEAAMSDERATSDDHQTSQSFQNVPNDVKPGGPEAAGTYLDTASVRGIQFVRKEGRCGGAWTFSNSRMTVGTLVSLHEAGESPESIADWYPPYTVEQITAALELPETVGVQRWFFPDPSTAPGWKSLRTAEASPAQEAGPLPGYAEARAAHEARRRALAPASAPPFKAGDKVYRKRRQAGVVKRVSPDGWITVQWSDASHDMAEIAGDLVHMMADERRSASDQSAEIERLKTELAWLYNVTAGSNVRPEVRDAVDGLLRAERARLENFRSRMQKAEAEVERLRSSKAFSASRMRRNAHHKSCPAGTADADCECLERELEDAHSEMQRLRAENARLAEHIETAAAQYLADLKMVRERYAERTGSALRCRHHPDASVTDVSFSCGDVEAGPCAPAECASVTSKTSDSSPLDTRAKHTETRARDEQAGTANAAAPPPGEAPKSPGANSASSPNAWPDCGCEDGTDPYEPSDRGFICPHDPRGVGHSSSLDQRARAYVATINDYTPTRAGDVLAGLLADVRRETIEACAHVAVDEELWTEEPGRLSETERRMVVGALQSVALAIRALQFTSPAKEKP